MELNQLPANMRKKQRGVVLVVSLVFLIALTAVAAALMQNTTTDMKMSGASQERVIATQEAISAMDEVIYTEVSKTGDGINLFARPVASFPAPANPDDFPTVDVTGLITDMDTTGQAMIVNPNGLEADCAHAASPSSVSEFTCNVLRVRVVRRYGRNNTNTVQVNSGVAQELLR